MENDGLNEITLLATKGDKEAFGSLYERYYTEFYRYALYMLKNPDDAKDAVAESICTAYRNIKKLKNEASFKPWMLKILYRQTLKQLKEKNFSEHDVNISEADKSEVSDLRVDLKSALMHLKEDDRSIVLLTVFYDYNSAEISQILHINRKTVRSKRARALKKMRDILTV